MICLAQAIASARAPLAYWKVFPAFPSPYYEDVELDFKDINCYYILNRPRQYFYCLGLFKKTIYKQGW